MPWNEMNEIKGFMHSWYTDGTALHYGQKVVWEVLWSRDRKSGLLIG